MIVPSASRPGVPRLRRLATSVKLHRGERLLLGVAIDQLRECVRRLERNIRVARSKGARKHIPQARRIERLENSVDVVLEVGKVPQQVDACSCTPASGSSRRASNAGQPTFTIIARLVSGRHSYTRFLGAHSTLRSSSKLCYQRRRTRRVATVCLKNGARRGE